MENIDLSEYLNKIFQYVEKNEKTHKHEKKQKLLYMIKSTGWFVKALFFNAGSKKYEDDTKPAYGKDNSERDIFSGKTKLNDNIRDYFKAGVNESKLALFFENRIIDEESLKLVMMNFDIDTDNANKKFLAKALSRQFKMIIESARESVKDIVADEYTELLNPQQNLDETLTQKAQSELASDLNNLYKALPELGRLSRLLVNIDEESIRFPDYVIKSSDIFNDIFANIRFYDVAVSNAINEFREQLACFAAFIIENTDEIYDSDYRKVKRFLSSKGLADMKTNILKRQGTLSLTIDNIHKLSDEKTDAAEQIRAGRNDNKNAVFSRFPMMDSLSENYQYPCEKSSDSLNSCEPD